MPHDVKDRTRLMVHENWRFRGYYRDAASWLRDGRIGSVKQAQLTLADIGRFCRTPTGFVRRWSGSPSCAGEQRHAWSPKC